MYNKRAILSIPNPVNSEKVNPAVNFVKDLKTKTDRELAKFMSTLYQHPEQAKKISENLGFLSWMNLNAYSSSSDTWSSIAKNIALRLPSVTSKQNTTDFIKGLLNDTTKPDIQPLNLDEFTQSGYKFLRALGRTLLLKNESGDMIAVKIQKAKEDPEELIKEFKTTKYIKDHAKDLNLEGKMPDPQSLNTLTNENLREYLKDVPSDSLTRFNSMIGRKPMYHTYIYKVGADHTDYFTYLHDISLTDEEFREANRIAIGNIYKLLSQQLTFPQLGDLFHNDGDYRMDKGRYQVLYNLLSDNIVGTGKLKEWKKAVAFPNVRGPKSGLADFGDYAPLSDFMEDGDLTKKYFQHVEYQFNSNVGNYLLANLIAEYQLVFFLIAGCRGASLTEKAEAEGKSPQEIDAIWSKIANQVLENSALALATLTSKSEQSAKAALSAIVDVDRLAHQMQFFMTPECVSYLKNLRIPEDIYGKDTWIEFDDVRSLNSKLGFSEDGVNPDLGSVSGQYPIKEADKLFYWINNFLMSSYLEFALTLEDVKKIAKEDSPEKIVQMSENSFSHLPPKNYHAANKEILSTIKERLEEQNKLSPEFKESLKAKLKEHQQNYAAIVIQNFWKNKKKTIENPKAEKIEPSIQPSPKKA